MWDESNETFGEYIQRHMPLAQEWWDKEQVQLDLTVVQGEDDSGLKWDELSDDHKRELILKVQAISPSGVSYKKYGRIQADTFISERKLWKTLGETSVFGVVDKEGLELKKGLRKLGVTDPSGTVLHEGRQLWKDLSIPERIDVVGRYLDLKNKKERERMKKELENAEKELEKAKKLAKRKSWFGF